MPYGPSPLTCQSRPSLTGLLSVRPPPDVELVPALGELEPPDDELPQAATANRLAATPVVKTSRRARRALIPRPACCSVTEPPFLCLPPVGTSCFDAVLP